MGIWDKLFNKKQKNIEQKRFEAAQRAAMNIIKKDKELKKAHPELFARISGYFINILYYLLKYYEFTKFKLEFMGVFDYGYVEPMERVQKMQRWVSALLYP